MSMLLDGSLFHPNCRLHFLMHKHLVLILSRPNCKVQFRTNKRFDERRLGRLVSIRIGKRWLEVIDFSFIDCQDMVLIEFKPTRYEIVFNNRNRFEVKVSRRDRRGFAQSSQRKFSIKKPIQNPKNHSLNFKLVS